MTDLGFISVYLFQSRRGKDDALRSRGEVNTPRLTVRGESLSALRSVKTAWGISRQPRARDEGQDAVGVG